MSTTDLQQPVSRGSGRATTAAATFGALSDAVRRCKTRAEFYREGLAVIGRSFHSPYACLYAQADSQLIQEHHHAGASDPGFWKPAVERYLTEGLDGGEPRARLLSAREAPIRIALLFAPLALDEDDTVGGVALVVPVQDGNVHQCMYFLDALTAFMMQSMQSVGGNQGAGASDDNAPSAAIGQTAGFDSPVQLAFSLTNSLRNRMGCEQVALALVRSRRCTILSISGLDEVKAKSPGVKLIQAAMEECVDLGRPAGCQLGDNDNDQAGDAPAVDTPIIHKQWHQSARGAAVLSLPFLDSDGCGAVLSLRRSSIDPFHQEEIDRVSSSIKPFIPAFGLIRQAKRNLFGHAVDSGRSIAGRVVRPGHVGMKLMILFVGALSAWVGFGTMGFNLTLPCTVALGHARQVAAPFDAVIADVQVRPGDFVNAGQVLCRLDTRDLELERRELAARLEIQQRERLKALADGPPIDARLAEASLRALQAKLDVVARRIEQAVIRSPIDGLIVQGDLEARVSGIVLRGEPLFQIADPNEWMLELEAPEWAVPELSPGLVGRFACHARPEQPSSMVVGRCRPVSEVREGRNLYVVEAGFESSASWIRPGMEGVARVNLGERRVWWVASFRVIDYLRLHYWL